MFTIIKQIFSKDAKANMDQPKSVTPVLYKDGVNEVCSSLDIILVEIERIGLLKPWNYSESCCTKQCESENKDSGCYHVVACLSGIIQVYALVALQKHLLEPLLAVDAIESISGQQTNLLKLTNYEKERLSDSLVYWYKRINLDWLLLKVKTEQFVESYNKSKCDKMFLSSLRDRENTFLTKNNLARFSTYEKCVVEYLTHPILLHMGSLLEGFIIETISEYKNTINQANVLQKPLNI